MRLSAASMSSRLLHAPSASGRRPARHPHPHPETLEAHLDAVVSGVYELQALECAQRVRQAASTAPSP